MVCPYSAKTDLLIGGPNIVNEFLIMEASVISAICIYADSLVSADSFEVVLRKDGFSCSHRRVQVHRAIGTLIITKYRGTIDTMFRQGPRLHCYQTGLMAGELVY